MAKTAVETVLPALEAPTEIQYASNSNHVQPVMSRSSQNASKSIASDTQSQTQAADQEKLPFSSRVRLALTNRTNLQFAACCFQAVVAGWNDACAGALIPYMERFFDINYIQVSTLFIGAFSGFVLSGVVNVWLTDRLGMGRVVSMGAALTMVGYAILLAPPPFALFPISYICIGFGIALQMASTVAFIATLPNSSIKMNYGQASYGVGALLSPFAATAVASSGTRFSYFFGLSLGLAFLNTISLFLAFGLDPEFGPPNKRVKELSGDDAPVTESIEMQSRSRTQEAVETDSKRAEEAVEQDPATLSSSAKNRAMLKNKTVWLIAIFLCFYVGAEVSIGGWAVSFLLVERGAKSDIGYTSTGFWAGITLGRLTLPRLQAKVGDTPCLYVYIFLALLLEFAVWFWKSLIGNAVAICLIGFLLSTFFGIAISLLTRLLPRHLHQGAIGLVAAAGQAGSAAFPFLTGALAGRFGPIALQPVVISLLVGMAGIWLLLPRVERRKE